MSKNFDTKSLHAAPAVDAERFSKLKIIFELRKGCNNTREQVDKQQWTR